uniref:ORF7 protein n=1 Tax=Bat Coronavirus MpGD16 TaxID=3018851 RepID=A0AA49ECI8_9NIDO|nr:ORF7 protein [Bat Coronavirus MpGD16]
MFLRKTRTSKSSLSRLMLIWILLVRKNQRSSANQRRRRRKKQPSHSTLQRLCLHHQLCCQMLLLKLSLRWLMRLLMLCLSLLHELSIKRCLPFAFSFLFCLALLLILLIAVMVSMAGLALILVKIRCLLAVQIWILSCLMLLHATPQLMLVIPQTCAAYLRLCKPNFSDLLAAQLLIAKSQPSGTFKYEFDYKPISADGYIVAVSVMDGFYRESKREHGRGGAAAEEDVVRKYTRPKIGASPELLVL